MKLLKIGTILLFLTFTASCTAPKKEIEYVTKVVYETPEVSRPVKTPFPEIELIINGDMLTYREQCRALIKQCNVDKQTIYNQSQGIVNE